MADTQISGLTLTALTAADEFAFRRGGTTYSGNVEGLLKTYSGATGIYLGGTVAANLLDDYEEGTFSPTLMDDSLSSLEGQLYSIRNGYYTKTGNRITFDIRMAMTNLGTVTQSNQLKIGDLPFTSNGSDQSSAHAGFVTNISVTAGVSIAGYIEAGTSYIKMMRHSETTGTDPFLISEFTASGDIIISGSYRAA